MRNWHRWTLTILIAFSVGFLTEFEDDKTTLVGALRHGAQTLVPALIALKMTLNPEERRTP